ncbi:MAG TPA: SDR family NAD(P)-dependent oxidoreductase, partial [Terriglobales bacterium]|nr:SDR family NAD(P)-dependent oxidoreductase [Terriglobales bacterium]
MAPKKQPWWPWAGVSLALAAGIAAALRPRPEWSLDGQVAVVTGGSRGLGLLLARELGREGCQLAICARDDDELARARGDLEARGITVHAVRCDVADRRDVERFAAEVVRRFGGIDILVNNAGIIKVGPARTMTVEDYEEALRVNFWGMVYPTLAMLPVMQAQGGARIVNITSIGARVSLPHLVPYSCAKFAALAFSRGLRTELAADGIQVVTVVPGLMRTGSYLNAVFKGDPRAESVWFSLGATLPGISMDAERAARQIVHATRRGDAEVILSAPARLLARVQAIFPSFTTEALRLVNELVLPTARGDTENAVRGHEAIGRGGSSMLRILTRLGRSAADRFGQHPGPR